VILEDLQKEIDLRVNERVMYNIALSLTDEEVFFAGDLIREYRRHLWDYLTHKRNLHRKKFSFNSQYSDDCWTYASMVDEKMKKNKLRDQLIELGVNHKKYHPKSW
jgi:hypothetical protein